MAVICGAMALAAAPNCQKDESPRSAGPSTPVLAKLAEADAFDGITDRVVAKCPACSLAMDGKAEHELKLGEYTLRFCSAHCLKEFADRPEPAVLALRIPNR